MNVNVHTLIQLIPDLLISFWFFRTIPPQKNASALRKAAALAALLLTAALYISAPSISNFIIRFLIRAISYALFIYLWYCQDALRSIYFALFACAAWTACQNILLTPILFPIVRGNPAFITNPLASELLSMLIRAVIMLIPLAIMSFIIPFRSIVGPGTSQWVVLCVVIVCDMYVKDTLRNISQQGQSQPLESSLFPLIMQVFLLAFMIFFEHSLTAQNMQKELRLQETINQYRIKNLESKQSGDRDLRQMHHDMKNHLLAIQSLTKDEESSAAVNEYIDNILSGIQSYETHVETGNKLLNGLISQKISESKANGITMDLIIDFRQINFIKDIDICTIFGNALDNAIEACSKVPDKDGRQIIVRTQQSAGQFLITIGNTYCGDIRIQNDLPKTSKKNADEHGIGLRNISRALKKYDGAMDINLDKPEWFQLTMLIPVKEA